MSTLGCINLTAKALIAGRTHIFSIVLPVSMGAVRDGLRLVELGLCLLYGWRFLQGRIFLGRDAVGCQAPC